MFNIITDFTADKFTPTKWDSAEKKARFAHQFIRFVESDFNEDRFPEVCYRRLSLTFGHIAHYNRQGFFQTFFMTTADNVRFMRLTLQHPCYGDAAFT